MKKLTTTTGDFALLTVDERRLLSAPNVMPCSLYSSAGYLGTKEVQRILAGEGQVLAGIGVLRKICNHPDLTTRVLMSGDPTYGDPEKSGKLKVTERVLQMWAEQGHR